MHAETKAELLALKSEMQAQMQAQTLALKSEMQAQTLALKSEMRQMKASMGSEIASLKLALMHGKNKAWSDNHKALFWMGGHSCQFCFALCCIALTSR